MINNRQMKNIPGLFIKAVFGLVCIWGICCGDGPDNPLSNTIPKPSFSPDGGNYTYFTNVFIQTTVTNAVIMYTTNGTAPSRVNGIVYTTNGVPLKPGLKDMVIRAKAFKEGFGCY